MSPSGLRQSDLRQHHLASGLQAGRIALVRISVQFNPECRRDARDNIAENPPAVARRHDSRDFGVVLLSEHVRVGSLIWMCRKAQITPHRKGIIEGRD